MLWGSVVQTVQIKNLPFILCKLMEALVRVNQLSEKHTSRIEDVSPCIQSSGLSINVTSHFMSLIKEKETMSRVVISEIVSLTFPSNQKTNKQASQPRADKWRHKDTTSHETRFFLLKAKSIFCNCILLEDSGSQIREYMFFYSRIYLQIFQCKSRTLFLKRYLALINLWKM